MMGSTLEQYTPSEAAVEKLEVRHGHLLLAERSQILSQPHHAHVLHVRTKHSEIRFLPAEKR